MKLQILLTISTLLLSCVHSANGDIVAGYVPAWKDVSNIDPSKFTHVNIAFAEPLANGTLSFESSFAVPEFVDKAKKAGTRVLLGLGGWSGSIYFSDILKSPDTRSKLISEVAEFVKSNHLDGVDMDWITNECNKADIQNDASNLLVFLQELRQKLDSGSVQYKPTVSLGVGIKPFVGPNGPLEDVSEYANLVDYIAILAYDMNSSQSNTTGPNAPLNYELGRGVQYSLISAIDSWTKAKFPADKILAGIAFYGRSLTTETDMSAEAWNLYQPHEEAVPRGDDDDGLWADKCSNKPPSYSGIWSYNNLRRQHVLNSPEAAESPWRRYWDSISLTPWVFNPVSKTFISYDDQASIRAKVDYVKGRGLKGVSIYDVTMDYKDELLNAIRNVIKPDGLQQPPAAQSTTSSNIGSSSSALNSSQTPAPTSSDKRLPEQASSTSSLSSAPTSGSSGGSGSGGSGSGSGSGSSSGNNSNSENKLPHVGDSCNQSGYRCLAEDGKSPQFILCAAGMWVQLQCGSGTACVQDSNSIYCDWPR